MIYLENGVYHFADPGYYILKSWANIGDSWLFDPDNNLLATVGELLQEEVFGVMDSVKVISLSDGSEIRISKSFGILRFPDFENGGFYELVGIQDSEYGESIPGFWEIYNFEVGDLFQYYVDEGHYDGSGIITRKITITSKEILSDSYQYSVDGIYHCFYSGMGGSGLEEYTYTDQLTFINSFEHPVNKFPGEIYLLPNSGSGIGTDRVFTSANIHLNSETGIIHKDIGTQEVNDVAFAADVYYELSETSDTLYRFEHVSVIDFPCGLMGLGFGSSIGDVYSSEGCFEYWNLKSLVGYIKGGDTVGTITPDSLLLTTVYNNIPKHNGISVFPNPASEILHISLPDFDNITFIELRNFQGVIVLQKELFNNEETIVIDKFKTGVYFYTIHNESTILIRGKILIN